MDNKSLQGKSSAWTAQDGSIIMGYTPKHAKPGSPREAGLSGHASAITVPSTGRHAAPENTAHREQPLPVAARGGKKNERRRLSLSAGRGGARG